MAFPATPLPLRAELQIGGAWTDILSRVRGDAGINITRGYSSEQFSLSAQQCGFTINNRDGLFSNKNPASAYYGKLGRNTPFRIGVIESGGVFAALPGFSGSGISTADKAVLDITGDIDIRCDFRAERGAWLAGNGDAFILGSKYRFTAGADRSWWFSINKGGYLWYRWSTNGTAVTTVQSTVALDPATLDDRLIVRVTHDVDNGAAGNTVTFYTGTSITGPWTAVGSAVVTSGTTSIFSGAAKLEVGTYDDGLSDPTISLLPFIGRIHRFQVYSGIAGTLVADMNATSRAHGDTSWSDGLGTPNTWAPYGYALVTDTDFRFWGKLPKLPTRWDVTGRDVYLPATGSGVLQQLMQGARTLKSPMFRYVTRSLTQSSIEGYWPCEDGSLATALSSGIADGPAATINNIGFGSAVDLPASGGVATITDTTSFIKGGFKSRGTGGSTENFLYVFKYPSAPAAEVETMFVQSTGTAALWSLRVTTSPGFRLVATAADGSTLLDSSAAMGVVPTQWIAVQLAITVSGGTVSAVLSWYNVSGISGSFFSPGISGSFAGSLGRFTRWTIANGGGKNTGLQVAQMVATRQSALMATGSLFFHAVTAWQTEYAGQRWDRLLTEEGVPHAVIGLRGNAFGSPVGESPAMGPQTSARLVDLLQECADIDHGAMYEARNFPGLMYRQRRALQNQNALPLSYSGSVFSAPLDPTPDDSTLRNDVTVSRPNGGSAEAVRTDGPLGTMSPVGTYEVPLTRNAYQDSQLPFLAQYEVALGTIDEDRWPTVRVDLARQGLVSDPVLSAAVARLDIGNALAITGLPAFYSADGVELLILGMTETINNNTTAREWSFAFNTGPYGPYRVMDLTGSALSRNRMSSGDLAGSYSTLAAGITSGALSLGITSTGRDWGSDQTKPGNFPLDIVISGERMTLSAITRTGSINVDPGTFESGVSGWVVSGGALVQSSAWADTGSFSGQLTVSGSPSQATVRPIGANRATIAPGQNLRVLVTANPTSSLTNMGPAIDWYSAGGTYLGTAAPAGVAHAANTPVDYSYDATVPALVAGQVPALAEYGPTVGGTPPNGTVVRFDNIDLINLGSDVQRATVSTRSVNGVVKAHSAGEQVQLADVAYMTLGVG